MTESGTGSVLRNRNFLALWVAQAITQTSAQMIWFAMLIVVEQTTRSTAHVSLALLTVILPSVAFGLIAGVVVDRVDKKKVLLTTNLLRAIAVLGYLFYPTTLAAIYVTNLVFVSIAQFFAPAELSMIPRVVPRPMIITATALFNITWTGSQLVGTVLLAPSLIKLFGAPVIFLASAVIYVVATFLVATLPGGEVLPRKLSDLHRDTVVRDLRGEIVEAWRFIADDVQTWWAMLVYTVGNALILVVVMLTPRYMVSVVGVAPEDAVFVFAPAGLGILLVTALLSPLANWFGKRRLVDIGLICAAVALAGIAVLESTQGVILPIVLAIVGNLVDLPLQHGLILPLMGLAGILGVGYALLTVPSQTIMIERAPSESRGRIFAFLLMLGNVAAILPLVILGNLADRVGVNPILAVLAALLGALLVFAYIQQRQPPVTAPREAK